MKTPALLIFLFLVVGLIPVFFINRWMQRVMRPRESAGKFFLFLFANFLLIIAYTVLLVGLVVRVF